MYYEINVSKNGRHLFATAERSLHTEADAFALADQFAKLFTASTGHQITVSRVMLSGERLDYAMPVEKLEPVPSLLKNQAE